MQPEEASFSREEEECDMKGLTLREKSSGLIEELFLQCPPNEEPILFSNLKAISTASLSKTRLQLILEGNPAIVEITKEEASEDAVSLSLERNVIISKHNWLEDAKWYEPRSGTIFEVDPETLSTTLLEEKVHEELADEGLQVATGEYAGRTLNPKSSAWSVVQKGDLITFLFLGSRLAERNFWNGRWSSEWTWDGREGGLVGRLEAFVHYFEEGNIQLRSSKAVELQLDLGDDKSYLAILEKIEEAEDAFQVALNEAYGTLGQDALKRLRRHLPVTRTRMDWSKIGAYGLGSELHARKK